MITCEREVYIFTRFPTSDSGDELGKHCPLSVCPMWQTCSYLNLHLIKSDWKLGSLVPLVTFLRAQERPVASGHHTAGTDRGQFHHCRKFYWIMLILDQLFYSKDEKTEAQNLVQQGL